MSEYFTHFSHFFSYCVKAMNPLLHTLLAELVLVLHSDFEVLRSNPSGSKFLVVHFMSMANKSFWGIGDNNKYPNGVASFLRTTANGGFSIKCLYVTCMWVEGIG